VSVCLSVCLCVCYSIVFVSDMCLDTRSLRQSADVGPEVVGNGCLVASLSVSCIGGDCTRPRPLDPRYGAAGRALKGELTPRDGRPAAASASVDGRQRRRAGRGPPVCRRPPSVRLSVRPTLGCSVTAGPLTLLAYITAHKPPPPQHQQQQQPHGIVRRCEHGKEITGV